MAIYSAYIRSKSRFKDEDEEAYDKFLEELKRRAREGDEYITTDALYTLIARYTWHIADRRPWNRKARSHYFRYFIRRAEGAGILKFVGRAGVWKILVGEYGEGER
jgi:hypothetical protein